MANRPTFSQRPIPEAHPVPTPHGHRRDAARVVVLRALGLGDLLTAVPALRALRRHHRAAELVLAAPAPLTRLARHAAGVDTVVDVNFTSSPPTDLPGALVGADLAVNLHGRGPRSHEALRRSQPGHLLAFRCDEAALRHGPPWHADEHEVDRWCRLLAWHGVPCEPTDLAVDVPPLPRLAGAAPRWAPLVLHPGASSRSRRWPPQRWARLARACQDAGWRPVLTGSAGETSLAQEVAERAGLPGSSVLAGRTSLWALARLVATAAAVVAGDTGVAHLATATRRPSVLLFGPTPPSQWGPRIDADRHVVLWSGERGDPRANRPHPGLLAITADEVVNALCRIAVTS